MVCFLRISILKTSRIKKLQKFIKILAQLFSNMYINCKQHILYIFFSVDCGESTARMGGAATSAVNNHLILKCL